MRVDVLVAAQRIPPDRSYPSFHKEHSGAKPIMGLAHPGLILPPAIPSRDLVWGIPDSFAFAFHREANLTGQGHSIIFDWWHPEYPHIRLFGTEEHPDIGGWTQIGDGLEINTRFDRPWRGPEGSSPSAWRPSLGPSGGAASVVLAGIPRIRDPRTRSCGSHW